MEESQWVKARLRSVSFQKAGFCGIMPLYMMTETGMHSDSMLTLEY